MKKNKYSMSGFFLTGCIVALVLAWFLPIDSAAEDMTLPSIEDLASGKPTGWLPPSIEELTQGKVKMGDLVTKDNVDLVKEYLTDSVYECVKKGMVLKMAENLPPEKIVPQYFWQATKENMGKAVMDENGTVRLQDGSPWPGGLPFLNPQSPLEAMANVKFGWATDDITLDQSPALYVGKSGNIEKTAKMRIWQSMAIGREKVPPLGAIPGQEDYQWRHMAFFTEPMEMKGMGQLTIRYYDEYKKPDEGFMYIPAFKRTIRVSATTYQDNVGGMDFTYGDPQGLREPFAYWNFKSMKNRLILKPAPKNPFPFVTPDGKIDPRMEFDHGHSFPRIGWTISPVIEVEAEPNIKHIYGKKVFYVYDPHVWGSNLAIDLVDIYDRQGKLWKSYVDMQHGEVYEGLEYYNCSWGIMMYDLQTGHSTVNPWNNFVNRDIKFESLNLTKLLQMGR